LSCTQAVSRGVLLGLACLALVIASTFLNASPASVLSVGRSSAKPAPLSSVLPAFGDHAMSARSVRLHAEHRLLAGGGSSANLAHADRLVAGAQINELTAPREPLPRTRHWRSQAPRGPPQAVRPTPV